MNKKKELLSGCAFLILLGAAGITSLCRPPAPVHAVSRGTQGLLFTGGELSCSDDYQQSLIDDLLYIYKTKQATDAKNIRQLIALTPEKAAPPGTNALPPCNTTLYAASWKTPER